LVSTLREILPSVIEGSNKERQEYDKVVKGRRIEKNEESKRLKGRWKKLLHYFINSLTQVSTMNYFEMDILIIQKAKYTFLQIFLLIIAGLPGYGKTFLASTRAQPTIELHFLMKIVAFEQMVPLTKKLGVVLWIPTEIG